MLTVTRTVYAKLDGGTRSETDFGIGKGILYTDELKYDVDYESLSEGEKTALAMDFNRSNDELLESLFEIDVKVNENND